MSSNLLTPKEAAEYLKVSEKTLEGWRCAEVGPKYYRMGHRRVRYFMSDITSWLRAEGPKRTKLGIPTDTPAEAQPC
ncbi:MAG: Helix-turn-helix domain [Proteobacteria bacterium]|nr:Helix-turn-helix domain [Pseudomonadota bacterium]